MKTKKSSNRTSLGPVYVGLILTAMASVGAFAQKDAANDTMPAPVRHDEQGGFQPAGHCFSVKGFAGYGGFYNVFTYNAQEDGSITENQDIGKAGFLGGLGLAYDYEGHRLFTGLDVDCQYNQPDGRSFADATGGSGEEMSVQFKSRVRMSLGLAAKIGVRITEQWLMYAIAGAAFSQFKHEVTLVENGNDPQVFKVNNIRPGFQFGLGMQMATTHKNLRAFIEVTRRQFGTISKSFTVNDNTDTFTIKPRNDMFRIGLKYAFLTL